MAVFLFNLRFGGGGLFLLLRPVGFQPELRFSVLWNFPFWDGCPMDTGSGAGGTARDIFHSRFQGRRLLEHPMGIAVGGHPFACDRGVVALFPPGNGALGAIATRSRAG